MQRYGLTTFADSPETRVLTLDQAKAHLRVTHTEDDDYIEACIEAAIDEAERYCNASFWPKTYLMTLTGWPCGKPVYLPVHPVIADSVSIAYRDSDGETQTLESSKYVVSLDRKPPEISCAPSCSWPSVQLYPSAVSVEFRAGFTTVPPAALVGIKLLLGHIYENREATVAGAQLSEIPLGAQHWLDRAKMWTL